jgi:hypothetical protein
LLNLKVELEFVNPTPEQADIVARLANLLEAKATAAVICT